jgi:hypothetical protein
LVDPSACRKTARPAISTFHPEAEDVTVEGRAAVDVADGQDGVVEALHGMADSC